VRRDDRDDLGLGETGLLHGTSWLGKTCQKVLLMGCLRIGEAYGNSPATHDRAPFHAPLLSRARLVLPVHAVLPLRDGWLATGLPVWMAGHGRFAFRARVVGRPVDPGRLLPGLGSDPCRDRRAGCRLAHLPCVEQAAGPPAILS